MNLVDLIPEGYMNAVQLEQLADEFLVQMLVGNLLITHLTTMHQFLMDIDPHNSSTNSSNQSSWTFLRTNVRASCCVWVWVRLEEDSLVVMQWVLLKLLHTTTTPTHQTRCLNSRRNHRWWITSRQSQNNRGVVDKCSSLISLKIMASSQILDAPTPRK